MTMRTADIEWKEKKTKAQRGRKVYAHYFFSFLLLTFLEVTSSFRPLTISRRRRRHISTTTTNRQPSRRTGVGVPCKPTILEDGQIPPQFVYFILVF